ncbi:MAG: hypothetical protein ABW195_08570 [Ilumatobacteraceae bacterium]
MTPSPAPAPSVPAVPEQAAHWWEPGPPGNSGDHRHDDDRGRPDSPGQSEQHVGADDDDGGLADPGSPDDEG